MRHVIRFGVAIVLCFGLSFVLRAVPQIGAHASIPVAGRTPHPFPAGSMRLYRTGADGGTLRPLALRTLADLPGPRLGTGMRPAANQYPAIVATSDGSRFAVMENIYPNERIPRAQDLALQLFDARTGAPLSSRHHPAVPVWISGISADGSVVYGLRADTDPSVPCASSAFYLLDTRTGRVVQHLIVAARPWDPILVGPNLQRLYTLTSSDHINGCGPQWSYSPTITAYDLSTGAKVYALRLKGVPAGNWRTNRTIGGIRVVADWTPGFALSPDGSQLAVLDGQTDRLTILRATSLTVAGTETLSRPTTGLQTIAALVGLIPDVAEAKGPQIGTTAQLQYTADGRSLIVTQWRLRPVKHHLYSRSEYLGMRLVDVAGGRIRAWHHDWKTTQLVGLWVAPDGSAVYSSVQGWTRQGGWQYTLRRQDPATLQVRARRTFVHAGTWWLNLIFLQHRR